MMDHDEFILMLQEYVKKVGSQKQAAENLEISTAYLNDVLHRRKEPGPKISEAFGLRKVITWTDDGNNTDWIWS